MAVKLTAVKLVEILPRGRNQAQQGQNRHERLAGKNACLAFGVFVVSDSDGGAFFGRYVGQCFSKPKKLLQLGRLFCIFAAQF